MKRLAPLLFCLCGVLCGDGGTTLFRASAGAFDVTVFSNGDAVRVGTNDISVLVQRHAGTATVMDATVLLHLSKSLNGEITRVTAIATHVKATNKTMYAATVNAPSAGLWRLMVDISAAGEQGTAAQNIEVKPPAPPIATYWPYIAMVPFALMAFAINRYLRRKMGRR